MTMPHKTIGIVIFYGIERLNIEGPLGVLEWTGRVANEQFKFRSLSKHGRPVREHLTSRELAVDGATEYAKVFDVLVVPGGARGQFQDDEELVDEIRRLGFASGIVAYVCTGAFLVAQTGLADGKQITTRWMARNAFRQQLPDITLSEERVEHDETLWSSARISAGIDMMLRLVATKWGVDVAKRVQAFLEYFPEPTYSREDISDREMIPDKGI